MQALQGQQALLQEQLSAAEASVQEAMAARQLQTERIKASKAAQKAGQWFCALAHVGLGATGWQQSLQWSPESRTSCLAVAVTSAMSSLLRSKLPAVGTKRGSPCLPGK